jgi:hypothetical protein
MQRKYGNELLLELQKTLAGLAEILKKLGIVDNLKTEEKERMRAILFIIQCYNKKYKLLN